LIAFQERSLGDIYLAADSKSFETLLDRNVSHEQGGSAASQVHSRTHNCKRVVVSSTGTKYSPDLGHTIAVHNKLSWYFFVLFVPFESL
jgi:hypothetical protein